MLASERLLECEVWDNQLLNTDVYRSYWNTVFKNKIDEWPKHAMEQLEDEIWHDNNEQIGTWWQNYNTEIYKNRTIASQHFKNKMIERLLQQKDRCKFTSIKENITCNLNCKLQDIDNRMVKIINSYKTDDINMEWLTELKN